MALSSGLHLHLQVDDSSLNEHLARARLRRWVLAALDSPAELTLRVVGRREGLALNRQFRGQDHATNILTFTYDGAVSTGNVCADLVLCGPVVLAEAREQGKHTLDHLAHLIIHGTLHAQGWDHTSEPDASRMEAQEVRILRRFRIPDPYGVPTP